MHFTSVLSLAAATAAALATFASAHPSSGNPLGLDRHLMHNKKAAILPAAAAPQRMARRGASVDGDCPKRLKRGFGASASGERKALDWSADDADAGRSALDEPTKTQKIKAAYATAAPWTESSSSSSDDWSKTDDSEASFSSTEDAAPTQWNDKSTSTRSSDSDSKPTKSSSSEQAQSTPADDVAPLTPSGNLSGAGLFSFVSSTCGKSGATEDITTMTGPNGAMDFLNCGLYSDGGWNPPDVHIDMVQAVSLDETIEDDNSPFSACKPYVYLFDKYGAELGLPPILLASIAMQESSCNAGAMGDNGGAYGLMQITEDKCTSGINCSDPDYNIKTGAYYFKSRLDANNGNILLALGEYNGWYSGLTVSKATAIKDTCCQCQNNLNYHQQMLNGWFQGRDGSSLGDWVMGCDSH